MGAGRGSARERSADYPSVVSGSQSRVFVARLADTPVFDPNGDPVGRVRDLLVILRGPTRPPRVVGLVVELLRHRRVFLPITRVLSIDPGRVVSTGLLNMARFERRTGEVLVIGELLDRDVTVRSTGDRVVVYDVGIEPTRTRDWVVAKVAVRGARTGIRRRAQTQVLDWDVVTGLMLDPAGQGTAALLGTLDGLKPADLARALNELNPKRRLEVATALPDDRLADVLEELPESDQVDILGHLDAARAADVLEAMDPDDAADLIAELAPDVAEQLLELMEPDDADDVRRLLTYAAGTAGALMTTEPIVLTPDATVADALARARHTEVSPALAATAFVCRPPADTPTGRFLGYAHLQRLLREPPSVLVSAVLDSELETLSPDAPLEEVTRLLATYNLVAAAVVDADGRLLGAVTVDDVLDAMLPDDWRSADPPGRTPPPRAAGSGEGGGPVAATRSVGRLAQAVANRGGVGSSGGPGGGPGGR